MNRAKDQGSFNGDGIEYLWPKGSSWAMSGGVDILRSSARVMISVMVIIGVKD